MPCKRWRHHKLFECPASKSRLNNNSSHDVDCALCAPEPSPSITSGCSCVSKYYNEDKDPECPMQNREQQANTQSNSKCPHLKNFEDVTNFEMPQCQALLRSLADDAIRSADTAHKSCKNPICSVSRALSQSLRFAAPPQPPCDKFSQSQSDPYGDDQWTNPPPPCARPQTQETPFSIDQWTNTPPPCVRPQTKENPFSIDLWTSQPPPCCKLPSQNQNDLYNDKQWMTQPPPCAEFSQNQGSSFNTDVWTSPPAPCCKLASKSKSCPYVNEQWTTPLASCSFPQNSLYSDESCKPAPQPCMLTQTEFIDEPSCGCKRHQSCCSKEACAKSIENQNPNICEWMPNSAPGLEKNWNCVGETQTPFLIPPPNTNESSGPCKEPKCIANKSSRKPSICGISPAPCQQPLQPCMSDNKSSKKSSICGISPAPCQQPLQPCKSESKSSKKSSICGISPAPCQQPLQPCMSENKSSKKSSICGISPAPCQQPLQPCMSENKSSKKSSMCGTSPAPCQKPIQPCISDKSSQKSSQKSICGVSPPPCQMPLQPCIAANEAFKSSCSKEERKRWKQEEKRLKQEEKRLKKEEKKLLKSLKEQKSATMPGTCSEPKCYANAECTCRFPPAFSQNYGCTAQLNGNRQCDCMNKNKD